MKEIDSKNNDALRGAFASIPLQDLFQYDSLGNAICPKKYLSNTTKARCVGCPVGDSCEYKGLLNKYNVRSNDLPQERTSDMEKDFEKMLYEIMEKAQKDCAFAIWRIYNDDNISTYDSWMFKPFTWLFIRMCKKIRFIKNRHRIRIMCHGCRDYGNCLIKDISNHKI